MSDVTNHKTAEDMSSEKRDTKHTVKGLAYHTEKYQGARISKCKQASKCLKRLQVLMESRENVADVQCELNNFIKCYEEAKKEHASFLSLPIPQDEVENQNKWFHTKMTLYSDFTEKVKKWLVDTGQPYAQPDIKCSEDVDVLSVTDSDEVGPGDSVSNISCYRYSHVKASSQLSRVSSTSSARIKAEAEKAALLEHVAAMKKRHLIEAQEEQLRKEKEKLALETEMAAANARIHVLETNASRNGSRVSNGMRSYFEKANAQTTSNLNPAVTAYVPKERSTDFLPPPLVVRPKERTQEQVSILVETQATNQVQETQQRSSMHAHTQPQRNSVGHVHSQTPMLSDNSQRDIVNIMQRQNDITTLLVQQSLSSSLPPRDIPVFNGDPLQYQAFIRAFENGVEEKTSNFGDCLHFLEQYTRGQP